MADYNWIETLESHDGVELFCQYLASPESVGVVVSIHDYGQHSGAYQKAHDYLVKHQFGVYTLDLRGHGKSPGDRASVPDFEAFVEDLDLLFARIKDREPLRPIFLLGLGMGAVIAMRFALTRRPHLHGMILVGKLPDLPMRPRERLLAEYATPLLSHIEASPEARERLLSPALSGALKNDALSFRGIIKAKTILELNNASFKVESEHAFFSFPVLCLGSESEWSAMERLHERLLTHDKTLVSLTGHGPQPLLGSDHELILDDIIAWCVARLEKLSDEEEWDQDIENDSV